MLRLISTLTLALLVASPAQARDLPARAIYRCDRGLIDLISPPKGRWFVVVNGEKYSVHLVDTENSKGGITVLSGAGEFDCDYPPITSARK